jgi:glycosyltransferase involved in cell wall biosynthesis
MNYRGCYEKRRENMPKIAVFTLAYNAERTLRRAVDSILAQTYGDWVWYLVDNGSTDSTRRIIDVLAKSDSRVIPIHYDVNHTLLDDKTIPLFKDLPNIIEKHPTGFFAMLDADDEYAPDFLEKSLAFMEKHKLDIVACGSQFVYEATGEKMNQAYAVENDMLLSGYTFSEKFPEYLQFMFTVWGKLYPLSLLRKCDFEYAKTLSYSSDTAFALEAFSHANRVGIIGGTLHKYYISPKSGSYKFDKKRVKSDRLAFNAYMIYLKNRNALTQRNIDVVHSVYLNAIKNTVTVALGADMSLSQKLDALNDIVANDITHKTMDHKSPALQERFKQAFYGVVDRWLRNTIAQSPLTRSLPPRSALFLRIPVVAVLENNIEAAETEIIRIANEDEIPDEHAEAYLTFAELLCAAAENANGWIFFKKLLARFLVDQGRLDEAKPKLNELAELLPEDREVAELRAAARG